MFLTDEVAQTVVFEQGLPENVVAGDQVFRTVVVFCVVVNVNVVVLIINSPGMIPGKVAGGVAVTHTVGCARHRLAIRAVPHGTVHVPTVLHHVEIDLVHHQLTHQQRIVVMLLQKAAQGRRVVWIVMLHDLFVHAPRHGQDPRIPYRLQRFPVALLFEQHGVTLRDAHHAAPRVVTVARYHDGRALSGEGVEHPIVVVRQAVHVAVRKGLTLVDAHGRFQRHIDVVHVGETDELVAGGERFQHAGGVQAANVVRVGYLGK